jgi:hypothetical protein
VDIKIDGNPFIAWLVYRGELYSPDVIDRRAVGFSFAWYQFFRSSWRDQRYVLEKELEEFQRTNVPNAISRLHGYFLFPSKELAQQAAHSGFSFTNLLEVEIAQGARISCYDMDWISYYVGKRSAGDFWFRDYFVGNPKSSTPTWEYVVNGRARIVSAIDLRKASDIVESFWPGYRHLLASARDACDQGTDGGAILPLVSSDGRQLYFDLKETTDSTLVADWKRLRSFISTQYVYPIH